jgi:hypothetical protein
VTVADARTSGALAALHAAGATSKRICTAGTALAAAVLACHNSPHDGSVIVIPPGTSDLEDFRTLLLDPNAPYDPSIKFPVILNLPEGFTLKTVREDVPSSWNVKHGAITTIEWVLNGPDRGDYIGFTFFPTAEKARSAWDSGQPHLPETYHMRSVGQIPVLKEANRDTRLFNGSISDLPGGFSATETVLGNVLIRTVTTSDLTHDSANATAAVELVFAMNDFLSRSSESTIKERH